MQRKNYKAYFTVEAAVLYPIVLGVIVLMTYLLFFQYDRCLLEQDMGRAAVRSGSRWMQKKDAAAPEENGYYICSEGECYHRRRDCPGLKRTVYCIARKDVDGYRECSRCGRI